MDEASIEQALTIFSLRKHTLKVGTQFMLYAEHQQFTSNFNDTYTFGGGGSAPVLDSNNSAVPGATETISGVEQYRRTLLKLPGGPHSVQQREWQALGAVHTIAGRCVRPGRHERRAWAAHPGRTALCLAERSHYLERYHAEIWAVVVTEATPITLHARVGMFATVFSERDEAEVMREDGVKRITSTVYDPVYNDPFSTGTATLSPDISNVDNVSQDVGIAHYLGLGFHVGFSYSSNRIWNDLRRRTSTIP